MRVNVAPDSITEFFFAEKALKHSDERLTFSIRDIVKGAVGFGFCGNALLNWMGGSSGITLHGLFFRDNPPPSRVTRNEFLEPDFPLRIEMRGAFRSHPGSEAL